ncbi:hypothetical protein AAF712_005178 [Marasmius tenuissimus]|uniref:Uncharacterized protein n=1 Tax=Marasmius tenuissimus TaxID=585030 RepID=A0ABR3A282_9AGAR
MDDKLSGILDGDVSALIHSTFASIIILLVFVAIQAIYASTIIHRRRISRLPQLPFIFILITSLTLLGAYTVRTVLFSRYYDASEVPRYVISPGPGALIILWQTSQRFADFFMLASLLAVLDYRRSLFKRDVLFTLFTTHKKRIIDIISLSLMAIVILAVVVLEARDPGIKESTFVPTSQANADAFSIIQAIENTYVVCYVGVSLNFVISTLYIWSQMKEIDAFRDETLLVLIKFSSPVIFVRAVFEITVAIISSARSFRTPFDPEVFLLVVTLVDGLAYVGVTTLVLSLDGKMSEGIRREGRPPSVLSM